VIVVLGDEQDDDDPGHALAQGLRDLGEDVLTLSSAPTSGDVMADSLGRLEARGAPIGAVVLASVGAATTQRGDLAGIGPDQWRDRVELPLRRTVACFQGAHRRLRLRGGSLVLIVPTLSLVGSSGFVPWATVAEGQRSLAKAAARAWGGEGITVNCLAVPCTLLTTSSTARSPVGDEAPVGAEERRSFGPDRPGQPAAALGALPDLRGAVAPVLASLVGGGWSGVTGATIAVDGGIWMTP
jgi:NAD(P)-dependent dehydrogenase (short-subunit alcohol dehydrogenase family)